MTAHSPADLADLAATVRKDLDVLVVDADGVRHAVPTGARDKVLASVDALVALCEQLKRAVREEAEQTCIEIDLRKAAERERDEMKEAYHQQTSEALEAARAALREATTIARHLHGMIDRETWREQGAEWMGQYEGDHWAEQARADIERLAALAVPDPEGDARG